MLEKQLLVELEEYIDRHIESYVSPLYFSYSEPARTIREECLQEISPDELEEFVNLTRKPAFSEVLFRFIDDNGAADSDIYKRAGIDRRHFSKIRSNAEYRPRKHTVIALALALELNETQTDELLSAAGFSLSDSETFDLVIRFFLEREIYNIAHINEALVHFHLNPLAGADE